MQENENRQVTINLVDYNNLLISHFRLNSLLDAIYDGASLAWDNSLKFKDENVDTMLRFCDGSRYDQVVRDLIAERDQWMDKAHKDEEEDKSE